MQGIMKHFYLIFTLIMMVICRFTSAQVQVLNVWTGKIPGSIENKDYREVTDSGDNWVKTRGITAPTLDYYPASKGEGKNTAVIICPGGGYWGLAIQHEGEQVARWFNGFGISAFVLKYRLPDTAIMMNKSIGPMEDGQEAIRLVRRHAEEWNIDPGKIGIMGFSAGGHLASTLSTHFNEKVYESSDNTSARPDFSILIYPVITMDASFTHMGSRENLLGNNPAAEIIRRFSNELQVTPQTPPAFMVHSLDDNAVPVQNSLAYIQALRMYNIPCELHLYESGGHGYGLGRSNDTESSWPGACKLWLKARGF
jgi:acetyl esterase/lipase